MNQGKFIDRKLIISGEIFFYLLTIFISLSFLNIIRVDFFNNYPDFRFLAGAVILLFIPGRIIFNLLYERKNIELWQKIPGYFVFSLLLLNLVVLGGYFFKYSVQEALAVFLVIGVGLIIFDLIKKIAIQRDLMKPRIDWIKIILLLFLIGIMALAYKTGGFLESDARFHIANVRKLLTDDFINAFNSHFKNGETYFPYAYSVENPILAMLAKFTNLDPIRVWFRSPVILAPLALLAIYSFSASIFCNRKIGIISIVVVSWLLFLDTTHNLIRFKTNIALLPFPLGISIFILMPMAFYFTFKYIREKDFRFLIGVLIVASALLWIHMYYFLVFGASLALVFFWLLIFERKRYLPKIKKLGILILAIVFLGLPYLILRFAAIDNRAVSNWGIRDFYYTQMIAIGDFYILHPKVFFSQTGESIASRLHLWALVFLGIFSLIYRHRLWFIFSAAIILGVLFVAVNPIVIEVLLRVAGDNKTWRLYQALFLPSILIISFGLFKLLKYEFLGKKTLFKLILVTVTVGFALTLCRGAISTMRVVVRRPNMERLATAYFDQEIQDRVNNNLKPRSKILAAPMISTIIPEYFDQYVFFGPSLSGQNQGKIESDARRMLVDPRGNIDLFDKYRPNYVLIDKKNNKYGNLAQFELLYKDSKFRLYEFGGK